MNTSRRLAIAPSGGPSAPSLAAVGGLGFALCMVASVAMSTETLAYLPRADDILAAYAGNTLPILIATYPCASARSFWQFTRWASLRCCMPKMIGRAATAAGAARASADLITPWPDLLP